MKPNRKNPLLAASRLSFPLASALVALLAAQSASALTWDITDNGATIEPGSGVWDLSATNWNGTPNVPWDQTDETSPTQSAVFAGADAAVDSYVVTLGSQMAATALTFSNTGYQLTGSTVYLTGIITVAAGKTATVNSSLSWASGARTHGINGTLNLGGGGSMSNHQWNGAGTLNLTAGTYTHSNQRYNAASTNQTGGIVNLTGSSSNGSWIGYQGTARSVNYTISGGTFNLNGTAGAYLGLGRAWSGFNSTLTVQTGGTVNFGTTSSGNLVISQDGTANTAKLDVQGGDLTVGTGDAANKITLFNGSAGASKNAVMTQSGGNVTANGIQFGGASGTIDPTALATLQLSSGNLYVGQLGIALGSGAATLPYLIQLQGGTLGASAAWSSPLDMKLTAATIRAQNSGTTAQNITLSGNLTDDTAVIGSLTKTGSGILTVSGTNTYTGTTTGTAGTLIATKAAALPGYNSPAMVIFNGGTIGAQIEVGVSGGWTTGEVDTLLANATTTSGALGIDTTNGDLAQWTAFTTTNFGPALGLVKLGSNTLTLDLANSYTGNTAIGAGTLRLANTAAVSGSSAVAVGGSGNTLQLATDTAFSSSTGLSIAGGTIVSDRATAGDGLTHAFAGNLGVSHATQNFTAGANVASGTAAIQVASMTCASGSGGTATLNPTTANLIITGNATGANTGTSTFALGGTSQGNSIGGAVENGTRTAQNLRKTNTSTWTLSGTSTYNGTTTVAGGKLTISSTGTINGTSAVTIGTAATAAAAEFNYNSSTALSQPLAFAATSTGGTLSGTGIITPDVTITSGNTLAPGSGGIGTLGFGGNLTLDTGSTASFEVDADAIANCDRLTGISTLTYGGILKITATGTLTAGDSWDLFDFTTQSGTFDNNSSFGTDGSTDPDLPDLGAGLVWQFNYATGALSVAATGGSAYDTWKAQITNGLNLRTDDADGDGFLNIQEFLFGTSPIAGNGALVTTSSSGGNLILRWLQRETGATYTLKQSSTLGVGSWTTAAQTPALDGVQAGAPTDYKYYTVSIPIGTGKLFFRIEGVEN
jgi:autotransporter-associated beta strand protein